MTTLAALTRSYQGDPESTFAAVEHATATGYAYLCRRLTDDHGTVQLTDIRARDLKRWHAEWTVSGVSLAHHMVSMLRTVTGYGATLWEDAAGNEQCRRIRAILHDMRFAMGKRDGAYLTFDQALKICERAHAHGWPSMALAQALQFETLLRQKDVIGSWVPNPMRTDGGRQAQAESRCRLSDEVLVGSGRADGSDGVVGDSDALKISGGIVTGNSREPSIWIKGLRWEEIDAAMILRHVTSKKKKLLVADLSLLPLVIEQLRTNDRAALPESGPVIVDEATGLPYQYHIYQRRWRLLAREAGIPDNVKNRHSRAGGITEATNAGADLETVRRAATHSNIATTQIYSRDNGEASARMMAKRVEARQNGAVA